MKVLITGASGQLGQEFQKIQPIKNIIHTNRLSRVRYNKYRTNKKSGTKRKRHNPYNKLCSIQQRRQSRRGMGKGIHNKRSCCT